MDFQDSYSELISRLIIGSEVIILVFVAYFLRAFVDHRSYQSQRLILTESDQLSSAISLSMYLFAAVYGLLESLTISTESLLAQSSEVAVKGLTIIITLEVSLTLINRVWLRGTDAKVQIHQEGNIAISVAQSGAILGMSFVLSAIFEQTGPWSSQLLWIGVGLGALFLVGSALQWLTPYDDLQQLKAGNISAALPLAGAWLASGITAQTALIGDSVSLSEDLISIALFIVLAIVLIVLARLSLKSIFFKGVDLNAEITSDQNIGVALFEATLYICVAEMVCYFLS